MTRKRNLAAIRDQNLLKHGRCTAAHGPLTTSPDLNMDPALLGRLLFEGRPNSSSFRDALHTERKFAVTRWRRRARSHTKCAPGVVLHEGLVEALHPVLTVPSLIRSGMFSAFGHIANWSQHRGRVVKTSHAGSTRLSSRGTRRREITACNALANEKRTSPVHGRVEGQHAIMVCVASVV